MAHERTLRIFRSAEAPLLEETPLQPVTSELTPAKLEGFGRMAQAGLNHAALFLRNEAFFENGTLLEQGFERMDRVVEAARKRADELSHKVRLLAETLGGKS